VDGYIIFDDCMTFQSEQSDVEENWINEAEKLILHWERETELIKSRVIDLQECSRISDVFRKECDSLLIRKPVGMTNEEVYTKMEKLGNKLNSTLAMVCRSSEEGTF